MNLTEKAFMLIMVLLAIALIINAVYHRLHPRRCQHGHPIYKRCGLCEMDVDSDMDNYW